jgi:hypothetical protein
MLTDRDVLAAVGVKGSIMAKQRVTADEAVFSLVGEEREKLRLERRRLEEDARFFRSLRPKPSNLVLRQPGMYEAPPPPKRRSFLDITEDLESVEHERGIRPRRGAVI